MFKKLGILILAFGLTANLNAASSSSSAQMSNPASDSYILEARELEDWLSPNPWSGNSARANANSQASEETEVPTIERLSYQSSSGIVTKEVKIGYSSVDFINHKIEEFLGKSDLFPFRIKTDEGKIINASFELTPFKDGKKQLFAIDKITKDIYSLDLSLLDTRELSVIINKFKDNNPLDKLSVLISFSKYGFNRSLSKKIGLVKNPIPHYYGQTYDQIIFNALKHNPKKAVEQLSSNELKRSLRIKNSGDYDYNNTTTGQISYKTALLWYILDYKSHFNSILDFPSRQITDISEILKRLIPSFSIAINDLDFLFKMHSKGEIPNESINRWNQVANLLITGFINDTNENKYTSGFKRIDRIISEILSAPYGKEQNEAIIEGIHFLDGKNFRINKQTFDQAIERVKAKIEEEAAKAQEFAPIIERTKDIYA